MAQSQPKSVDKCDDLSGTYVRAAEDNGVYVSIVQSQCSRMDLMWEFSYRPKSEWVTHHLILDGTRHQIARDDSAGFAVDHHQIQHFFARPQIQPL